MQNNSLTGIRNDTTIRLAGQTESGSAEVQPARDNRLIATDCRWDGGTIAVIPFTNKQQFGAFQCLKKPSCRRQELSLKYEMDLSNSR
jgi:hypothetical protein